MEENNQNNSANSQITIEQNNTANENMQGTTQNSNIQNTNINSQNNSIETEQPISSTLSKIAMGITIFQTVANVLFIVALFLKIKIEESYNYVLMIPGFLISLILSIISRIKYKDKLSKVTMIIDIIFIVLKIILFVGTIALVIIGTRMLIENFVYAINGCDG